MGSRRMKVGDRSQGREYFAGFLNKCCARTCSGLGSNRKRAQQ